MIRHITFSSYFIEMKKSGFLRPHEAGLNPSAHTVICEKDWRGDAYFKAVFIAGNSMPGVSFSPYDLVSLIFNEHDLLIKGYQVNDSGEDEKSGIKSMLSRKEISMDEFNQIGDFVSIKDEIPLVYLVNIDIPDAERLKKLGLI